MDYREFRRQAAFNVALNSIGRGPSQRHIDEIEQHLPRVIDDARGYIALVTGLTPGDGHALTTLKAAVQRATEERLDRYEERSFIRENDWDRFLEAGVEGVSAGTEALFTTTDVGYVDRHSNNAVLFADRLLRISTESGEPLMAGPRQFRSIVRVLAQQTVLANVPWLRFDQPGQSISSNLGLRRHEGRDDVRLLLGYGAAIERWVDVAKNNREPALELAGPAPKASVSAALRANGTELLGKVPFMRLATHRQIGSRWVEQVSAAVDSRSYPATAMSDRTKLPYGLEWHDTSKWFRRTTGAGPDH